MKQHIKTFIDRAIQEVPTLAATESHALCQSTDYSIASFVYFVRADVHKKHPAVLDLPEFTSTLNFLAGNGHEKELNLINLPLDELRTLLQRKEN